MYLDYNENITDEGLKYIPNIQKLNLYDNKNITDEGLKYITNIKELHMDTMKYNR